MVLPPDRSLRLKRGDLVRVDVNLMEGFTPLSIYLGEFKDPVFGILARVLTTSGRIRDVHHDHLRKV